MVDLDKLHKVLTEQKLADRESIARNALRQLAGLIQVWLVPWLVINDAPPTDMVATLIFLSALQWANIIRVTYILVRAYRNERL